MVPFQGFLEHEYRKNTEHHDGDDLLYDLELIARHTFEFAQAVGRYHEGILYKGDEPADDHGFPEGDVFEFEVTIPGDGHEDVRYQQ